MDQSGEGAGDTVAIIPARAGSKGLPGKNLKRIQGRTLIGHAAAVARQVAGVDTVIVSTDGDAIATEAQAWGAEVHWRSPALASDTAPVIDTIRHVLSERQRNGRDVPYGLLLEPTTPLRTALDVSQCLAALRNGAHSAATFTEAALHPYRAFRIEGSAVGPFIAGAVPWTPRQALQPPAYQLSGACYAFRCADLPREGFSLLFGDVIPVMVPRDRSLDIDDVTDLAVVETLMGARSPT